MTYKHVAHRSLAIKVLVDVTKVPNMIRQVVSSQSATKHHQQRAVGENGIRSVALRKLVKRSCASTTSVIVASKCMKRTLARSVSVF